jgi:hypothetical protein
MPYELGLIIEQQGNIIRRREWEEAIASANGLLAAFAQLYETAIVPWVEHANQVFLELGEALIPVMEHVRNFINVTDATMLVPAEDLELAFRDYAADYNARHPGRRVSWRRLNRPQRQAAAWEYLARESA